MNIFTFTLLILTTATLSLLLYLSIKHLNNTTQKTIDLAEHHNAIIKNICTIAYAAAEFEKTLDKETPEYQRLNTKHFQTIRLYTRISNITFPPTEHEDLRDVIWAAIHGLPDQHTKLNQQNISRAYARWYTDNIERIIPLLRENTLAHDAAVQEINLNRINKLILKYRPKTLGMTSI